MSRIPALVIGGGPAGSIAALHLARGGMRPLLIERDSEGHDPVCGGFVSADALRLLSRSGIDPARLQGHPIERMRFFVQGRTLEAALPFPAVGLSRRRLDAVLVAAARQAGTEVEFGRSARTLSEDRTLSLGDGGTVTADAIILATGKLNLRGVDRPGHSARGDAKVGLRRALRPAPSCRAALSGTIELHLFAGGYAGLVLQEDGLLNLCLSVSATRLREAAGSPDRLLAMICEEAPTLAERIGAASPIGAWRSIACIPYGWRATRTSPGLFRVGDQAAVIASLAGDGIAIAIASATAASRALLRGGPAAAPAFQRDFARAARWPLACGEALRRIAETPGWARSVARLVAIRPDMLAWGARATRIAQAA
jgi:flavin-dependent dehydrogenase